MCVDGGGGEGGQERMGERGVERGQGVVCILCIPNINSLQNHPA